MAKRTKVTAAAKRRDVFDWVGVAVNVVQALIYVVAIVAALYWYVVRGGGLPAVLVGLAVTVVILLTCAVYTLVKLRRDRCSSLDDYPR